MRMKSFEVFHLTSLRRILTIKWFYHVSNGEVLRLAGVVFIKTSIGSARLQWFGHVFRLPETSQRKFGIRDVWYAGQRKSGTRTAEKCQITKKNNSQINQIIRLVVPNNN